MKMIKINKKIAMGIFFLVGIFLVLSMTFALSVPFSKSNPQFSAPGGTSTNFLRSQGVDIFPSFNPDMCGKGQDFVLQIAPFGCSPTIVRSDLLEEQNVPVFCQIAATKINPLIDVESIESMSFKGQYPEEVSGVGFHPARAAVKSQKTLLNSPILENIGYAVIVLRQQKNESAMPDFVDGNLTAKIKYDIENAFGIGKANYYLPEINDNEWGEKYKQYGFWNGKGFLRAESVEADSAVISIYSDESNKLSTFNLKKGQTSSQIYLPGFYCLANLKVRLDGLEAPDTRAKLEINGEIVEVAEDEQFLQNSCRAKNVEKQGINQKVGISCRTDEGVDKFELRIVPKIKLDIDGEEKKEGYNVGDFLYKTKDEKGFVYLAYVGTGKEKGVIVSLTNSNDEKDLFVFLIKIPLEKPKLSDSEISSMASFVKRIAHSKTTGIGIINAAVNYAKLYTSGAEIVFRYFANGIEPTFIFLDETDNIGGKNVKLLGSAKPTDNTKIFEESNELKQNYENAMSDYRKIIDSFPNEKENKDSQETFAERALIDSIKLANSAEQKKKMVELCQEFEERYSDSENKPSELCNDNLKISNSEISTHSIFVKGNVKEISFKGIYEPSPDEYSAEIFVRMPDGKSQFFILRKNQIINLGDDKQEIYALKFSTSTPIYYKYVNNWEWSPDKENWMPTSTTTVSGGYYDDKSPVKEQEKIIELLKGKDLEKGKEILVEKSAKIESIVSNEFIQLISLDTDSARLNVNLNADTTLDKLAKITLISSTKVLKKDVGDSFGSKYTFTLTKINLENVARVSVLPGIENAGTEANLSFRIGIEKRGIQLSPDEINDKLEILNQSIEKWEGNSESLGEVVKGFNAACLATGTVLTAKNFFSNLDGKSIARKEVMRSDGGWTDICKDKVSKEEFSSIDSCLLEHNDEIKNDVEGYLQAMDGISINDENLCGELGKIKEGLGDQITNGQTGNNVKKIDISGDVAEAFKADVKEKGKKNEKDVCSQVSLTQAKKLLTYQRFLKSNPNSDLKSSLEKERYLILSDVDKNVKNLAEYNKYLKDIKEKGWMTGATNVDFQSSDKDAVVGKYGGAEANSKHGDIKKEDLVQPISFDNERYYVTLKDNGRNLYSIKNIHKENGIALDDKKDKDKINTIKSRYGKGFRKYDRTIYQNEFKNPEVRYFETEPYKGSPAIVPFDTSNGWYAATKQTLPGFGKIRTYDDSGKVASFWLCNVGENGKANFNSVSSGDDICQQFNPGTGKIYGTFPGLNEGDTGKLVSKAIRAIEEAQRKHESGVRCVKITGVDKCVQVGNPAVDTPDMQCQDFMSPKECNLLFNVCDPVVCPSSRCDLGGLYPVADVVQSGIVGSALLCLPNIKENIYVPVCLSGVKAGMDSWISVQKNYRDCLQENLDTGATIGICDEIHSIYMCDFFWSQAAPLSQVAIPKIFEFLTGQSGSRGGGEYAGVQSAWQNAKDSTNYMTQYYGANSFQAFNVKATESIGKAVCRNFVSGTVPSDIGLEGLIEPRSPPQFSAWFSEQVFTTATVPPTSQYKVFFHIYAGENNLQNVGAYYSVYLKSPAGTSFYQANPTVTVASGYIAKGDYASETKDFTAPTGYKELCIRVNAQEECGFKQVSTEFSVNYLNDLYMKEQASQTDIDSETSCVSGTPSLYGLINPNLQAGATNVIDPALYDQGIVRICSTDNPGRGTDTAAGTKSGRWQEVGTCDDGRGKIKCYLDIKSVKDVIKSIDLEDQTLEEVGNNNLERLKKEGKYLSDEEFSKVSGLNPKNKEDRNKILKIITDKFIERALLNNQRAKLLLIRGGAYSEVFKEKFIFYLGTLFDPSDDPEGLGPKKTEAQEAKEAKVEAQPKAKVEPESKVTTSEKNFFEKAIEGLGKRIDDLEKLIRGFFSKEAKKPTLPPPKSNVQNIFGNNDIIIKLNLYRGIIKETSGKFEISKDLIGGIILQESKAVVDAEGDDGSSFGLMQISKDATEDVKGKYDNSDAVIISINTNTFKDDLKDPLKNIYAGTAYYKILYDYYESKGNSEEDSKKIALAAYNWGRGNVKNTCDGELWTNCKKIPEVVLQYVSDILEYENLFKTTPTVWTDKDQKLTSVY